MSMRLTDKPCFEWAPAICYSGYRDGQSPLTESYPSLAQVTEDLLLLQRQWRYLRIYDCSRHADLVLDAIRRNGLDLKVMLGADLGAEIQSPACPWMNDHPQHVLEQNAQANDQQIARLIDLAHEYGDIVFSVSIGNEATVEWSDHRVSVERLLDFVQRIKATVKQPVTFCENYVPWTDQLEVLAQQLDFISLHSYPVWEYQAIEQALDYTRQNYHQVASRYPDKPVIITEAGWTTQSNGRGIDTWNASQDFQADYCRQLIEWSCEQNILTFVFEAFDEPWKGSEDPAEPEKHWGLFGVDRKPKKVMQEIYRKAY